MLLQGRVLLDLPASATCTTDFSTFTCFYRSVCSLLYLARQPVRLVFPIFSLFFTVFAFWGGVSYFPEFPKLPISRHAAPEEIRLRGRQKG